MKTSSSMKATGKPGSAFAAALSLAVNLATLTLFALSMSARVAAHSVSGPPTASAPAPPPAERLGSVEFAESCAPAVHASFNRGIALLHDFWYDEAEPQFELIVKAYPTCAMAHWGIAMSLFHQIWDRPSDAVMARAWQELQAAQAHPARTRREREYVAAASDFFRPDQRDYQARIEAYAAAMGVLYGRYPQDVDAGAFYALALLAAESPDDTSLKQERKAMDVLRPLNVKYPDNPGVVHYIIHACDTPSLAAQGLAAANHYGEIAASGPHAVHMPGHIFSRLGMWQADIDSQVASVAASRAAEARHMSGSMDQLHSDDFLMYAYLQSGQDAHAKAVLAEVSGVLDHFEAMPDMSDHYMIGMFPYYRAKFPIFYDLEMRDWPAAAALEPIKTAPSDTQLLTQWARAIADGHLHQAQRARADLAAYDALLDDVKKGKQAYLAGGTRERIVRAEMLAWIAFAEDDAGAAVQHMREAADLQDEVGQGEVDIPAREMLADILLELKQPRDALVEYQKALQLSPNRFNGLFNAGRAAEAADDNAAAGEFYATLLKNTDDGRDSARPELAHARAFVSSMRLASQ
jgi:tetratricopeptide (TPR) repeat protein